APRGTLLQALRPQRPRAPRGAECARGCAGRAGLLPQKGAQADHAAAAGPAAALVAKLRASRSCPPRLAWLADLIVCDGEPGVEGGDRLVDLLLGDDERWCD